jgi:hypothetical protein
MKRSAPVMASRERQAEAACCAAFRNLSGCSAQAAAAGRANLDAAIAANLTELGYGH